jgi:uncharacterized membrane protein YeaQ/YmgE (transglycosylase-associated protein family)
MLRMLGHAVLGLLVGIVAKLLMPGHDPGGFIVTALIGMAGGWLGGLIAAGLAGTTRIILPALECRS